MTRLWLLAFILMVISMKFLESTEQEISNLYHSYYDKQLQEDVLKVNSLGNGTSINDTYFHPFSPETIGALFLNGTGLKELFVHTFYNHKSLSRLHLNNNTITTLDKDIFKRPKKLWLLYLQKNNLRELPRNLFSELHLLHFLDLSSNKIESLGHDIFQNLSSLWSLSLERNRLESIPENLFAYVTSLSFLHLDENKLASLNESLFKSLLSLRYLSLKGNSLTSLPNNIFQNLTSLLYLNLSDNKFTRLVDKWFRNLHSLKSLHITHNAVENLEPRVFSNMAKLVYINLDNNMILELREDIFLGLKSLQVFSMRRNALLSFDLTLLMKQMDLVDLEDNNIQQVFCSNEYFAVKLGTLSLSENRLTKLPACYFRLGHISVLDLSRNQLDLSVFADFSLLVYMQEENEKGNYNQLINLGQNLVTSLHLSSSHMVSNIEWVLQQVGLQMTGNNLICDCTAYKLYTILVKTYINRSSGLMRGFLRSWVCSGTKKQLIEMKASELRCVIPDLEGCPSNCQCAQSPHDFSVLVNCQGKGLQALPLTVPDNTTVLDVQNNSISELSKRNYLSRLSVLNMNNNSVSVIDDKAVLKLVYITELHLVGNSIKRLPKSFDKLNATRFSFSRNPLDCDCNGIFTRDWIVKHYGVILDIDLFTCQGSRYLDSDFVCRLKPSEIALIALSIAIVVVIVCTLFFYYYRREIKVFFFTRFKWHPFDRAQERNISYKLYDGFVAYAKEDAGWVGYTLAPKIETPTSPHRLCMEDRDYLAGDRITKNILYSIKYSRRMILCLTNSFLRNEWCMFQFLMAHRLVLQGSSHYLIIILFDHIKYDDLNLELKAYLRTGTYIEYNDKWFWQKLAYAMPVDPLLMLRGLEFPNGGFGCLVPSALSLLNIPNTGLSQEEIRSLIREELREGS